jgi:hypothetical protein
MSKPSRKVVADVKHLDAASQALVAALEREDNLTVASFEAGATLGTGTFGRVFVAKHKSSVSCGLFCFFLALACGCGPWTMCSGTVESPSAKPETDREPPASYWPCGV